MTRALDLGFELTNLCNLHCTHCIRGSHQAEIDRLDLPFIAGVLDQAVALFDPVDVVFTGGEPLASEIFAPVVGELRRRGLSWRFVTNGWLIPRHLRTLMAHPPRFVRVSLSGATARTHDEQRGAGSFERALLAVATLLSRGLRAQLSMVILRGNRGQLADAITLAGTLGVDELHFILPQPTPESALDGSDLSPLEWNEVASDIRALCLTAPLPVLLDYGTSMPLPRALCNTLAFRQLYVDAKGRVPFCCQLSRYGSGEEVIIGDLRSETLAVIAQRARALYDVEVRDTTRRHEAGDWDALDDYPCLSCARRKGRTGFLAEFPEHSWTALAGSA